MIKVYTKNEIFSRYNRGDKCILANLLLDGDEVSGPYYIKHLFKSEREFGIVNVNCDLSEVLSRAIEPEESL